MCYIRKKKENLLHKIKSFEKYFVKNSKVKFNEI